MTALPLLDYAPRSLPASFLDPDAGDDDFIFEGLVDVLDEPPEPDNNDQLAWTSNSLLVPGSPEFEEAMASIVPHAGVSGLSKEHAAKARELDAVVARVLVAHAPQVRYTQGSDRWGAIDQNIIPWDKSGKLNGQFLHRGDCSSTSTWKLGWVVLHHHFHTTRDVMNGQALRAGFTGTMVVHGKEVVHQSNWKVGDRLFYGPSVWATEHVTDYMGGGVVFSHGSDAGPYFLKYDYRGDHVATRRYL